MENNDRITALETTVNGMKDQITRVMEMMQQLMPLVRQENQGRDEDRRDQERRDHERRDGERRDPERREEEWQNRRYHDFDHHNDGYKIKVDLQAFSETLDVEAVMDWLAEVERFFEIMNVEEERRVTIVAYKLKRGAAAWWQSVVRERYRKRLGPVQDWITMRQMIEQRFLPSDHMQTLYNRYHDCMQKNRKVDEYTEEFLRLQSRCDNCENEDQQVAHYQRGLRREICCMLYDGSVCNLYSN